MHTSHMAGLSHPPQSWTVIPPDQTISRHVEVLLSVESTIYSVDNLENLDQRISRGPFTHMSPSPNGKSLALLTVSGLLWVVSTDFQRSLAEFDTTGVVGASGDVHQVEWCGNDAVLVTWRGVAVLVGPFGDTLQYVCYVLVLVLTKSFMVSAHIFRYFYPGSMFATTEPDGIRLIGPDTCDFVQKVPGMLYLTSSRQFIALMLPFSIVCLSFPPRIDLPVCHPLRCMGELFAEVTKG